MVAKVLQRDQVDASELTILSGSSLFCERDDRILFKDLNFSIREGEVFQIKGSNGSGKTTLLRIICGLNDSYEGVVSWYGEPIEEKAEEYYNALTYIGHRIGVNKVLSPVENLRWSCGLQQSISYKEIYDALAKMDLKGFEESQCFTLSAGQQKRVALSKLLISQARLWVLDEPFTALDYKGVEQLEALVRQHADRGGSVLITTHHSLSVSGLQVLELG
ncbi:MAG: heme ABC transporter ATP-binding protein CcmA [Gammaproteobacteria bacterium]|nr:heme ABC transporter ATP-binding protein CcmA [Gammaproteobacteria bacterium]|tara:strand:+ start:154 stop:810 length:657 start_codon:yes stop_codon:yes gene_type:complete